MFSALVLLCLAAAIPNFGMVDGKLEHLIVSYRAQEHSPVDYDKRLIIANADALEGKLTEKGKEDAFGFGRELATKYGDQLGITTAWKDEDFWTFGTKSARTRWAALLVGAGLKNDGQGSSQTFDDQKLTAATYSLADSFTRFTYPDKCPAFFKELAGKKAELVALSQKYQTALGAVAAKYPAVKEAPYLAWLAYETFVALKANGREGEIDAGIKSEMENLKKLSEEIVFAMESTDELKKISGGRILDDIIFDMEAKLAGKPIPSPTRDGTKIRSTLIGAPQAIVGAQLAAFNPTGTKYGGQELTPATFYPEQGASHVVELHNDGGWKVKVLYRQKLGGEYKEAEFPGCGSTLCDFAKFKDAVKHLRVARADAEATCTKV